MGRDVRLQLRIALAVGAGAVAVAVGVALLVANTVKLRQDSNRAIQTNAYLLSAIDVDRLVVDAETGLRGYVITGQKLFLQPLDNAEKQFQGAATALRVDAKRGHAYIQQADALTGSAHSYLTDYVPSVVTLAQHNLRTSQSFSVTLEGKDLVDSIREQTATLESLISERQDANQRSAGSLANHSVVEGIIVLVVLTVLTTLLGAILGRIAVARERARERSDRTAEILQRSLLPHTLPDMPGCELAVRFSPAGAGELVGGDFYDVFAVGAKRWAIVLGDVCGKGAEAAAVTAMARWTLRSFAGEPEDAAEPVRFLNDAMLRQELGGRFITIAYMLITVSERSAHVSIACAGHPAPIFVPSAGEPVAVETRGTLVGVWPDLWIEPVALELTPGDSIVVYTDGVTDQGPHSRPDTPDAMLVDPGPNPTAERLAQLVESYAHQLRGPQRDDVAILALRFTGEYGDEHSTPSGHERTRQPALPGSYSA